jgi:hypothetical protein
MILSSAGGPASVARVDTAAGRKISEIMRANSLLAG